MTNDHHYVCMNDPAADDYRLEGEAGCFAWDVYVVGDDPEDEEAPWRAEYVGCGQIDPEVLYEGDDPIRAVRAVADRLLNELADQHKALKRFADSPAALRALANELRLAAAERDDATDDRTDEPPQERLRLWAPVPFESGPRLVPFTADDDTQEPLSSPVVPPPSK